ncbi:DMT family transporter [Leeia sp. TBRC 13508]|uniref:DMT family transporter n=1 Tax=Leeia speluncae TaxID=2884804 RepID=A0ABS8D1R9_9NEIS|nr:DMT family transporter [Leeia speluncae]MCB6182139.1 DMT family transporter [Leeia speluncae]
MNTDKEPSSALFKNGALWMLIAGFCFACMGALVKLGSEHFSTAELVFYRSFISLVIITVTMRLNGHSFKTHYLKNHLTRSISGTISLMLSFYAVAKLPLATATTLTYTSSIFLAILTFFVAKRRPSRHLFLSIGIGFLGVVVLLQPTIGNNHVGPFIIGLLSGFLAAIAYLNVKELGKLGEPSWRVVFYFTLTASFGAFLLMLTDKFHSVTGVGGLELIGIGASATIAQLALTKAYRQGQSLVVASLAYSTVVFSVIFSAILWNNSINWLSYLGILLIICSGVISVIASSGK